MQKLGGRGGGQDGTKNMGVEEEADRAAQGGHPPAPHHSDGTPHAELFLYAFFPSRRRHTRGSRDWSSDVCSSDLLVFVSPLQQVADLELDRDVHDEQAD